MKKKKKKKEKIGREFCVGLTLLFGGLPNRKRGDNHFEIVKFRVQRNCSLIRRLT